VRARRAAVGFLAVAALWQLGQGLYIPLKAALAQLLIAQAWAQALRGEGPGRAWPWADFTPAGRLRVPAHDVDLIVLSNASGRSLAFGPGWMTDEPWKGAGVAAVAGHRDTHFDFVRALHRGDSVELQDESGRWYRYLVSELKVIDPAEGALRVACARECVALVTCDSRRGAGGDAPLRIVAIALRVSPPSVSAPAVAAAF